MATATRDSRGRIRAGIGGWTFDAWNGSFYPDGLKAKEELHFASRALKVIEVNGTYYSTMKPATFAKWAADVPEDFVFTLKASRYTTNRKVLGEGGESVARFLGSGLVELGPHLGPILWQFMPTKRFEPEDFESFLQLLPEKLEGLPLRHAVEVRHPSFLVPEFIALLAKYKVAPVLADHADYPLIADQTADFSYLRLQTGSDAVPTCYEPERMALWAGRARDLAAGGVAEGLPLIATAPKKNAAPRDVFVFFIHEGKVNAPQGAQHFQQEIDRAA